MVVPYIVPPITTYRDYFPCAESYPSKDRYVEVLGTYNIDMVNHTATITPKDLGIQIFDATTKRDPTMFILWLATPGVDASNKPGRVKILHTVLQYALKSGRVATALYGKGFNYCRDVHHNIVAITD